jgi:polyphosphate kinase
MSRRLRCGQSARASALPSSRSCRCSRPSRSIRAIPSRTSATSRLNLIAMLSGKHEPGRAGVRGGAGAPGAAAPGARARGVAACAPSSCSSTTSSRSTGELFPGFRLPGAWAFRVIRNFDLSIDEEEAEDLLESMKQEVRTPRPRQRRGASSVDGRIHASAVDDARLARSSPGRSAVRVPRRWAAEPVRTSSHLGASRSSRHDPRPARRALRAAASAAVPRTDETSSRRSRRATCSCITPTSRSTPSCELLEQGGARPERARHQADALPHERRQPDRQGARARRRERQAGHRARRDQGPLRRGEQHRRGRAAWKRRACTSSTASSASRPTRRSRSSCAASADELRRYVHLGTGNYNPCDRAPLHRPLASSRPAGDRRGRDSLFNLLTVVHRAADAGSARRRAARPPRAGLALIEREAAHGPPGRPRASSRR